MNKRAIDKDNYSCKRCKEQEEELKQAKVKITTLKRRLAKKDEELEELKRTSKMGRDKKMVTDMYM
uniref:Uncharacterized protein n=1 Tax=Arundo donax TaxID=35708 RepID=A0A0A9HSX2_ARUDO